MKATTEIKRNLSTRTAIVVMLQKGYTLWHGKMR